jgi:hypothetical protein
VGPGPVREDPRPDGQRLRRVRRRSGWSRSSTTRGRPWSGSCRTCGGTSTTTTRGRGHRCCPQSARTPTGPAHGSATRRCGRRRAAATPARIPLGDLAPDMVRLDAETKQITHAIRMAAYNAKTRPGPRPRRPLRPARPGPSPLPRHRPHPAIPGEKPPRHCMNYLAMSGVLSLQAGSKLSSYSK